MLLGTSSFGVGVKKKNLNNNKMLYRVVITKEEDCYLADIPSLKHCFAGGGTIEEAIEAGEKMLAEA